MQTFMDTRYFPRAEWGPHAAVTAHPTSPSRRCRAGEGGGERGARAGVTRKPTRSALMRERELTGGAARPRDVARSGARDLECFVSSVVRSRAR